MAHSISTAATDPADDPVVGRWQALDSKRSNALDRKRRCAALTLPFLLPHTDDIERNNSETLATPYQSLGARGVETLASKLALSLFPPKVPFFESVVDESVLQELEQQEPAIREEIEKKMLDRDKIIQEYIENTALRVHVDMCLKFLVCTDDPLFFVPIDSDDYKVFRPDQFVINRDGMGNILEIIIKECVDPKGLSADIRAQIAVAPIKPVSINSSSANEDTVEIYTWIRRQENKRYNIAQTVQQVPLSDPQTNIAAENLPYIAPNWFRVSGENYGRSHAEAYLGDLNSLEGLYTMIILGGAAMAKVLWMVNPNGTTTLADIATTETGAVINGNSDDVTQLLAEGKGADFTIALKVAEIIDTRLSQAFLLNSSIQRDAERVTAVEIRLMANELNDSLGGIFSRLSLEFQLPLLRLIIKRLERRGKIKRLGSLGVQAQVVTGIASLGRGHDLENLISLSNVIQSNPEFAPFVKMGNLFHRYLQALGIDSDGLLKTRDELQQDQQQQQLTALAEKTAGPVAANLTAPQPSP